VTGVERPETDCLQVLTTVGSEQEASRISEELVERRLAACVQVVGPIRSRYRWHGEIQEDDEWQCVAKTVKRLYPRVEEAIRELHSYEEPEILATPVAAVSAGYLKWVREST
jgi:periplasmic divalent cation tolerance protein